MTRPALPRPHRARLVAATLASMLAIGPSGCAYLGLWGEGDGESSPPPLVLREDTPASPQEEREASRMLDAATEFLAAGDAERAQELARRIAEEFAGTAASGPSLLVEARAALEMGAPEEARALARRYEELLPGDDPRSVNLALFDAEEALADGRAAEATRALLALPSDAPAPTVEWTLVRLRDALRALPLDSLAALLDPPPADSARVGAVLVANARAAWHVADGERTADLAREALRAGARGPDATEARALLRRVRTGDLPGPSRARMRVTGPFDLATPVTVGALLPSSGSPAMRRYAGLLEEGLRVALEGEGAPEGLKLLVRDDGGDPGGAVRALKALEATPVVAVLGPLEEEELLAAADARTEPVLMISPTARGVGGREAVYSLSGPDPGAAHALAEYALESGLEQVVVIHPATPEHGWEAEAFRERMIELGGSVLRVLSYAPGTTTFEEQLQTARHLEPHALVLPVPAEDIVALAPQVSFFGLDTLGIRVLGTGEWTREEVLMEVATRHTDGVVVATARSPQGENEGFRRFEEAYERHFQRSLRDRVPALGYDAARLVLQALRSGARNAAELRTALEWVEDLPGATGVLTVDDGRVLREHHLVCVQNRELLPVSPGQRITYYRPERPGDPEKDEPERVPLGPPRFFCPGVPVPDSVLVEVRPAPPWDTTRLRRP